MGANNGAVLDPVLKFVKEARADADRDGRRRPGRTTLAKQVATELAKPLGTAEYEVRLAIEQLDQEEKEALARERAGDRGRKPGSPAHTQPAPNGSERPEPIGDVSDRPDVDQVTPVPAGSPVRQAGAPAGPAPGAKFWAWFGFGFGSLMSIAANVLYTWLPAPHRPPDWTPGTAPQIGAAAWPIALVISVEVLSRVRWRPGFLWSLTRYGGAGTVALGSAIISYGHLREVLIQWGYGQPGANVGPLVLDGLMVVSGFALLSMSDRQGGNST